MTTIYINLKSDDDVIKNRFRTLDTFEDIANLLEIKPKMLRDILVINKGKNYKSFVIKKKNGGERTIYSPEKNLSILQKKFLYILNLVYRNHENAHGFVRDKSIKTNATSHLGQNYILNFDLKDFFENINFGRVRSMFMSYFKFNTIIATTLANLCCHEDGFLPQGAATSPAIANILSYNLDKTFSKLAKKEKCVYTRYADDITFSTNREKFPKNIAFQKKGQVLLSSYVEKIIRENGFLINESKTRLHNKYQNLSVTGITVNQKLNVSRKYIRKIRSILHCIEKNISNLELAEKLFCEKYTFRQRKNSNTPNMFDVLKGMISHLGNVRGKSDDIYIKLATRYNILVNNIDKPEIKLPISAQKFQERNTFVVDSLYSKYSLYGAEDQVLNGQGTGFLLKNVGLITNAHVLYDNIDLLDDGAEYKTEYYIRVHQSKYSIDNKQYYAKIVYYDSFRDIAILSIKDINLNTEGYSYNEEINPNQSIKLIGYPQYIDGQDLRVLDGHIMNSRIHTDGTRTQKRYEISATIFGGNSGGPIVNANNEVIAVAAKGISDKGSVPFEVIPISDVIKIYN
ncbi:reverse transcriptase domain-containing protein, partial [Niallia circulans]|uniref:reverse transcriptase domain-containing protein n=1 Tax=Niallia circulans TaxID=1397 RepID=UPI001EFF2C19